MGSKEAILSSFIENAPPGELQNVVADLQILASKQQVEALEPAFQKYNEEQHTTVKLPGSSTAVLISKHNALGQSRYHDAASQTSFKLQHNTQTASDIQQHSHESTHSQLIKSLQASFSQASAEHFPDYTIGVYPTGEQGVAALLVANKYSPSNFWNGRWRSVYLIQPSSSSIEGQIKVDVHYYEDGNVRMNTKKAVKIGSGGGDAATIVREIAKAENAFQTELNRAFITLAEGSFKGLRRQLPVTRQRVEWEKIGGYRLGQDIGGGGRTK